MKSNNNFKQFRKTHLFVNRNGDIYSQKTNKILSPTPDKDGYLRVNFDKTSTGVHRIVMEVFNPVPNMENLEVNHINQIKTDNRLENLEWCTHEENMKKIFGESKKNLSFAGEKNCKAKLSWEDVHWIRSNKNKMTQKDMVKKFNVSKSTISAIINNKTWIEK